MNKYIYAVVGLVVLAVIIYAFSQPVSGGLVTSQRFMDLYKNTPQAVMLDVRTPSEFDSGHIAGAINIDFENPSVFALEIKKLDKNATYFVYCRSGNRSSKAIVLMRKESINNIYELQGGIVSAPELLQQ